MPFRLFVQLHLKIWSRLFGSRVNISHDVYLSRPSPQKGKKTIAFKNIEAIVSQSDSTKFQDLWSKSNAVAYSPVTPVSLIMDFISVLDKNKEDWTPQSVHQDIGRSAFDGTFQLPSPSSQYRH